MNSEQRRRCSAPFKSFPPMAPLVCSVESLVHRSAPGSVPRSSFSVLVLRSSFFVLRSPMIVIVGAGAAGLLAAIFAARRARRPCSSSSAPSDGGRKILISGGGRCNILPSVLAPERFVTDSPAHLMRGMLRSWPLAQQRGVLRARAAACRSRSRPRSGKLFPASNRARDVRDALVGHARALGVSFQFETHVTGLAPNGRRTGRCATDARRSIAASRVVARDRRPLGTGDRQRWRRARHRRGAGPSRSCRLSRADAAHGRSAPHAALERRVADRSRCARASGATATETHGRISLHASRLQRPRRARHLACRGARAANGATDPARRAGAVGGARTHATWQSMLTAPGGLVATAIARTRAAALARGAARGGGRAARSARSPTCAAPSARRSSIG